MSIKHENFHALSNVNELERQLKVVTNEDKVNVNELERQLRVVIK